MEYLGVFDAVPGVCVAQLRCCIGEDGVEGAEDIAVCQVADCVDVHLEVDFVPLPISVGRGRGSTCRTRVSNCV